MNLGGEVWSGPEWSRVEWNVVICTGHMEYRVLFDISCVNYNVRSSELATDICNI